MNIFHGLTVDAKLDRDNKANRRICTLLALGFPIVLAEKPLVQYTQNYTRGYGEVAKSIVTPEKIFNVREVLEEKASGKVYFDRISILDALRFLAYVRKWCLHFEGKKIYFRPCKKRRATQTINLSELDKVTVKKEL